MLLEAGDSAGAGEPDCLPVSESPDFTTSCVTRLAEKTGIKKGELRKYDTD